MSNKEQPWEGGGGQEWEREKLFSVYSSELLTLKKMFFLVKKKKNTKNH